MNEEARRDPDANPAEDQPIGQEIEDAEILESTPAPAAGGGKGRGVSGIALVLALLALACVFAALGFGYRYFSGMQVSLGQMDAALEQAGARQAELQRRLDETRAAFEAQKREIEAQQEKLAAQEQRLAEERDKVSQQGSEMQETLQAVYQRVGRNSTAWIAAEAEYLLQVANHRLRLEGDVKTAIRALEAADARLRDTGDPGWINVRELLAIDIVALKGVAEFDRAGLAARLSGMTELVGRLKMSGVRPLEASTEGDVTKDSADEGEERSLETLLRDGWDGFKSVMVIRHHNKPVTATLPPEQQYFVYQNIRLQLESARLALLRGDQAMYDAGLRSAAGWLVDFFDPEDAQTRSLGEQIKEMATVRVQPGLPDISRSLAALQDRSKSLGEGSEAQ